MQVALEVLVHEPSQKLVRIAKLEHDVRPKLVRKSWICVHRALEQSSRPLLLVPLLLDSQPVLQFLVLLRVEHGEHSVEFLVQSAY